MHNKLKHWPTTTNEKNKIIRALICRTKTITKKKKKT